jgi:hypothetical protein
VQDAVETQQREAGQTFLPPLPVDAAGDTSNKRRGPFPSPGLTSELPASVCGPCPPHVPDDAQGLPPSPPPSPSLFSSPSTPPCLASSPAARSEDRWKAQAVLEAAAAAGNLALVARLLEQGANPVASNPMTGATALGRSYSNLRLDCYRLLEVREGGREGERERQVVQAHARQGGVCPQTLPLPPRYLPADNAARTPPALSSLQSSRHSAGAAGPTGGDRWGHGLCAQQSRGETSTLCAGHASLGAGASGEG